jgi:short-subunit dehydrogenase
VTMLPRILAHGEGGHIVNTASMSGLVPVGGTTIYSTAKAAVITMMETMRPELEGRGVICSAFCPGAVQSNIADAAATRPAALAESGYAEADKRRQNGGNFMHLYQTKEEVGQRVLQGILNDELYILTHSEFLDGVSDRANAMIASVPAKLPQNQEYKQTFAMLFNSPVWAAEIARQKVLKA